MKITAIKSPLVHPHDNLEVVLRQTLKTVPERSIVVVTSKVVALCEGAVAAKPAELEAGTAKATPASAEEGHDKDFKHDLVRQEAELYLEPSSSQFNVMLTIRHGLLAVNAGIDESNADGVYVYLPPDPYASAEKIWHFLRKEYGVKEVGVVITDSTSMPFKWGTVGRSLSHCGFEGLTDFIGKPDLFGRLMVMTKMNVVEGIAAAAVLEMGEGSEQTPICLAQEVSHLYFMTRPLSAAEVSDLHISLDDDVYAPVLKSAGWQKKVVK